MIKLLVKIKTICCSEGCISGFEILPVESYLKLSTVGFELLFFIN